MQAILWILRLLLGSQVPVVQALKDESDVDDDSEDDDDKSATQ